MSDKLRLLCVDDEEQILKTFERFCHNEGIAVLTAGSSAEALEILEREPVTVVISDHQMPGMNGLDLLHEIHCRWPRIIRIIVSGFLDSSTVTLALQQGKIFGFLPKPWQRNDLKALIQAAADQYSAESNMERAS